MDAERDERIKRLLQRGVPKLQIAQRLGIARETVDRVAARVGFPARNRGLLRHDWEAIRSFYEAGHSAAECGRRFGFSDSTWVAAIARGDIVPRPRYTQLPPGKRRREVAALLEQGFGIAQIAERLGISKPTVCYHARKLGVPARTEFARRHDWSQISEAYESGVSMRECKTRFGFSSQAWYDAVARGDIDPRSRLIPLEELLVRGRRTSRGHLKTRLVDAGLKQNRCERCGIAEWRGEALSMALHHINGDGRDNRLPNLLFLCPNCHAQTPNYGGKGGHRHKGHLRLVGSEGGSAEPPVGDKEEESQDVA